MIIATSDQSKQFTFQIVLSASVTRYEDDTRFFHTSWVLDFSQLQNVGKDEVVAADAIFGEQEGLGEVHTALLLVNLITACQLLRSVSLRIALPFIPGASQ